jgi:hypothetical protein
VIVRAHFVLLVGGGREIFAEREKYFCKNLTDS